LLVLAYVYFNVHCQTDKQTDRQTETIIAPVICLERQKMM
jgi:hypothetical protein